MTPVMARVADQILDVLDPLIGRIDAVLALAPDEVDAMLTGTGPLIPGPGSACSHDRARSATYRRSPRSRRRSPQSPGPLGIIEPASPGANPTIPEGSRLPSRAQGGGPCHMHW